MLIIIIVVVVVIIIIIITIEFCIDTKLNEPILSSYSGKYFSF